jgi:hypothetical protein
LEGLAQQLQRGAWDAEVAEKATSRKKKATAGMRFTQLEM